MPHWLMRSSTLQSLFNPLWNQFTIDIDHWSHVKALLHEWRPMFNIRIRPSHFKLNYLNLGCCKVLPRIWMRWRNRKWLKCEQQQQWGWSQNLKQLGCQFTWKKTRTPVQRRSYLTSWPTVRSRSPIKRKQFGHEILHIRSRCDVRSSPR